eukprot:278579_1
MALLGSGIMDMFHTIAADKLIRHTNDDPNFVPYTWAISRLCNSVVLLGSSTFIVYKYMKHKSHWRASREFGMIIIPSFAAAEATALAIITVILATTNLPETQFPDQIITRPFDVYPLGIYIVLLVMLWMYFHFSRTYFVFGLALGEIVDISVQAYMAFGSSKLFDAGFNIAHFLKIFSFLLPSIGLMFDLSLAYHERVRKLEDIMTNLQETNTELKVATVQARASLRAKATFLATMSHEIRTPMNGILGMTTLLEDTKLSEEQKEYAGTIRSSADLLLRIVDDLLIYSKAEANKISPEIIPFNPNDIVKEAMQLVESQASERDIDLSMEVDESVPLKVFSDPVRVRQIMLNFLSNAL